MQSAEGGCLCGKLRYKVDKKPSRATICHCKFCQRATGSAYLVEPICEASDFNVINGTPKTYTHTSDGSGKNVYIHFCDHCGTKLFLTFERFPEIVGAYGGTFDDPDWIDTPPENTKHIFLGTARKGTVIPPHVATFLEHATENDGTPIDPTFLDEPKIIGSD
jgi:hypothetical protein